MTRQGWITRLTALAKRLREGGAVAVITPDEYDEIAGHLSVEGNSLFHDDDLARAIGSGIKMFKSHHGEVITPGLFDSLKKRIFGEVRVLRDREDRARKMPGVRLIADERFRQMHGEHWTSEHDDQHVEGELRDAAIAYLQACDPRAGEHALDVWPWEPSWFKPADQLRNLAKAGALIAAEIDRLTRQEQK